ncbi:2-phospho-L-lactate guanylyltransferase [Burkholderia anthina]|uniref:2-phospho-L-lactate guanylyltransferase n=1 Tax=Burkholderia anthina TaxID=179879 RepID=UPI00158EF7CF
MTPSLWAVVPVKSFSRAKQRLASVLSATERAGLAQAMLADVLDALRRSAGVAGVLVVTADPHAARVAREAGATVTSAAETGLNDALAHGARQLAAWPSHGMLVVPADVPLITPADIDSIALAHRASRAVTLVAATDDGGTNALACSPPQAIPFAFGADSLRRHRQLARAAGLPQCVLTLPRIGRDIDRPDDLHLLLDDPSPAHTRAWLAASGVAQRLRARRPTPLAAADAYADDALTQKD